MAQTMMRERCGKAWRRVRRELMREYGDKAGKRYAGRIRALLTANRPRDAWRLAYVLRVELHRCAALEAAALAENAATGTLR